MTYAICDEQTGEISHIAGTPGDAMPGQVAVSCPVDQSPDTHYQSDGRLLPYSYEGVLRRKSRPSVPGFRWSVSAEDWIDERPIDDVKSALIVRLKRTRDALLEAGFEWDGSRFDSDAAISQPRLLGLFTSAMNGMLPPEGYPWRLQDNSWRMLSSADAAQVWGTFQYHMARLFAAFAVHEATVLASDDIDFLRSYNTDAGWPTT